jgi:CheY-like chemotaxis protein
MEKKFQRKIDNKKLSSEKGKKEIGKEVEQEEKEKKFLFIDDNKAFLESLQRFFSSGENQFPFLLFEECHSVKEAINAVFKHHPDVLFIDNDLEGMGNNDGIEVIDEIKNKGLNIKVYSITGSTDKNILSEYEKRNIEIASKFKIFDILNAIIKEMSEKSKKD